MDDTEPLWSSEQAAEYLGLNPVTLRRWRRRGYGPPAILLGTSARGGVLRYRPAEVRAWLDAIADAPGRVPA